MLRTFKDLVAWQKSFAFSVRMYEVSQRFPREERYGLTAQLRRASVSIPSNVAEGYSRDTTRDYIRFLWMARGSLAECETQLLICKQLRLASAEAIDGLLRDVSEINRIMTALIKSLKKKMHEAPGDTR